MKKISVIGEVFLFIERDKKMTNSNLLFFLNIEQRDVEENKIDGGKKNKQTSFF
jgi:hypothetical protein